MTIALLRSQDCLRDRFQVPMPMPMPMPVKSRRNANPNVDAKTSSRSRRRKQRQAASQDNQRYQDRALGSKTPAKNLVMGQVKILKRGEKLSSVGVVAPGRKDCHGSPVRFKLEKDLALCSTERLGPKPETVQEQIGDPEFNLVEGVYAGSAFVDSPLPSSLPLPAFFAKENKTVAVTTDLMRLLRLEAV